MNNNGKTVAYSISSSVVDSLGRLAHFHVLLPCSILKKLDVNLFARNLNIPHHRASDEAVFN